MALIKSATHEEFDLSQIHRGDCIRVRRAGDTTAKNGFVTEVTTNKKQAADFVLQHAEQRYQLP